MLQGKYETSNTALAAYLISEGFSLSEIDYSDPQRANFIFPNNNESLSQCARNFQMAQAKGNIVLFFNSYRTLLRKIRNESEW